MLPLTDHARPPDKEPDGPGVKECDLICVAVCVWPWLWPFPVMMTNPFNERGMKTAVRNSCMQM